MLFLKVFFIFFLSTLSYSQDFSFLGLEIGMTKEQILESIQDSPDLIPSEDILLTQIIPPTPYTLVLKANNSNNNIVQKVFIDFYEQQSYQITIFLNSKYFSFYTLSEKLLDTYSTCQMRNAKKVVWNKDDNTKRITLEYPSTVKITDIPILQQVLTRQELILKQDSNNSLESQEQKRILDEL